MLFLLFGFKARSQRIETWQSPKVTVIVSLAKDTFRLNDDIQLIITLQNETNQIQSVWFDRPKTSTGGPAWTSVTLINKTTGKSVLKYENKAILSSQAYTIEEVKSFLYQLKPGERIKGHFSLYDLAVTNTENFKLSKGTYEMKVYYAMNQSNSLNFTVD